MQNSQRVRLKLKLHAAEAGGLQAKEEFCKSNHESRFMITQKSEELQLVIPCDN
jgi:hypothetical protein